LEVLLLAQIGKATIVDWRLPLSRGAAACPARGFFAGEKMEAVAHTMREEMNGCIARSDGTDR
jgi:hypothetical protein